MWWLKLWFRRRFHRRHVDIRDDDLPFTAEEFGRLISSGKPDDMRTLAARMSMNTPSPGEPRRVQSAKH